MSNATIFMALQCCQCSIMQVKQKKKSSSDRKWTCVVCNQKQSVRKVFAQGYMAKHLRPFVQSFNMEQQQQQQQVMPNKKTKLSLCSSGDDDQFYAPNLSSQAHDIGAKGTQLSMSSKWRDYLTQEDKEEPKTSQPTMTNRTPDDMKNPSKAASRWSEYLTEDDQEPQEKGEWKNGVFKTQTSQPTMTSKTQDDMNYPSKAASRRSEYLTEDDQEPQEKGDWRNGVFKTQTSQPTMTNKTQDDMKYPSQAASRWSEYLTEDDQEPQEKGEWKNSAFETHNHDLQVEDDIHPDFI